MKRVESKTAKRENKYWDLYSVLQQNGVKQTAEASSLGDLMHVEDEGFYERILADSMSMSGGGGGSGTDDNNRGGDEETDAPIDDETDAPVDDGTDGSATDAPEDGNKSGSEDTGFGGIEPKEICQGKGGMFGEQTGTPGEVTFGYELETTNGGKDLVAGIEHETNNIMLSTLFPDECGDGVVAKPALRSGAGTVEGVSAKPDDVELVGVECATPPASGNSCEVYKGAYTMFYGEGTTDSFKQTQEILSLEAIALGSDAIVDSHPEIVGMKVVDLSNYQTGQEDDNNLNGVRGVSSDSGDDPNVGVIIGPIIGGVVLLALAAYALSRKKKRDSQQEQLLEEGNGENFADE